MVRIRDKNGVIHEVPILNGNAISVVGGGESIAYPVADEPETMGQRACLARAAHFRDIKLVPVDNLECRSNTYEKYSTAYGIPYSSTRRTDNFIGYNVSLHTFMTALNNSKSVLYTKHSDEKLAKTWYGLNCTVYVSYCWGLPYHSATSIFPFMDCVDKVEVVEEMKLCDAAVSSSRVDGGTAGHAVLITGIERNQDGSIANVTISHCTGYDVDTKKYTKAETMTYEYFVAEYIELQKYRIYRYKDLWSTTYTPNEYVPLLGEPTDRVSYSDLCTNLGDKATLAVGESIILQPLKTSGYENIVLYRDGEQIATYDVGEVTLSNLTAGKYVAKMGDAETSFIVADVSVIKEGNCYTFAGDGTPLRVVFKDSEGYTLRAVDLTEEDRANGYINIPVNDDSKGANHIRVPFRNEYGFVTAECGYTESAVEPELPDGELPEGYQKLEYIKTNGDQYINTGVKASDHADGILYTFIGTRTGSIDGNNYLFGCLNNNSRSGNASFYPSYEYNNDYILVYAGASSVPVLKKIAPVIDTEIELKVQCTSKDLSSLQGWVNGADMVTNINASVGNDMPSAEIYLFTANGVANTNGKYCGTLKSFVMSKYDGTLIRNFVPCRMGNVGGLYDTVGGKFYTSEDGSEFEKGADV